MNEETEVKAVKIIKESVSKWVENFHFQLQW